MSKASALVTFPTFAACLFILLAAIDSTSNKVLAAELSLPKVAASSGDTVTVSVKYRAQGDAVSALGFDLAYDSPLAAPRSLTITAFGAERAATAPGKD